MPPVQVGRVYDDGAGRDGVRVLVDRLWPRGLSRQAARVDEWVKEVAPSTGLRTWYGHDPAKSAEFRRRYLAELADPRRAAALDRLRRLADAGPVTLLTAARDVEHSHAIVLAELLRGPKRPPERDAR